MAAAERRSARRWRCLTPAFKQETANLVKKITRLLLVHFSFQLTASPPTAPSRCVLWPGQGWEVRCRGSLLHLCPGLSISLPVCKVCSAKQPNSEVIKELENCLTHCAEPQPLLFGGSPSCSGHLWVVPAPWGQPWRCQGRGSHPAHPEALQHRLCPPHTIFLSLFILKGLLHPCLRILLEDEIQY